MVSDDWVKDLIIPPQPRYVIMDCYSRYFGLTSPDYRPCWVLSQARSVSFDINGAITCKHELEQQDGSDLPLRIERIISEDETEAINDTTEGVE